MEFKNVEMLPGVIIDCNDPKNIGRVKAIVPTLFDTTTGMTKDLLPWIYPLTMWGYQSFSKMLNGSKIWVINNKDNEYEYWYIPMFELIGQTQDNASKSDADIVISRKSNGGNALMMYEDAQGFTILTGTNKILIKPNDEIFIGNDNTSVKIENNKVYLGNGDYKPAVNSEELKNIIGKMQQIVAKMGSVCNGPLQPLQPGMTELSQELGNYSSKVTFGEPKVFVS